MDTLSPVLLFAALATPALGVAGFVWLCGHSPRAALVVVFFLLVGSRYVDAGDSRLLHGLVGVLRLVSFLGGIVAVVALAREPVGRRRDEQTPPPLP